jgi:hypothetical protein
MRKEFDIREVKSFYDSVGWQINEDGVYQNARYEDLRLFHARISINVICALIAIFLIKENISWTPGRDRSSTLSILLFARLFLSGLSRSILCALQDARKRIGSHGLFVVADVANLPFVDAQFDDVVSLHTFHHLRWQGEESICGGFSECLNRDQARLS